MLQQILNDMYVDPELLSELDEEQKQILFCKMREEQVRKWRLRNEEAQEEEDYTKKKEGGKKVSFLMGGDGEPLVVVLGGDEDVDAILQERAKLQAEMEGEALRKAAEEELDKLVRLSQSTVKAMERNSQRIQHTSKISDPTRDAVVRSLQEATKEMEDEMRALELQEKEGLSEELPPSPLSSSYSPSSPTPSSPSPSSPSPSSPSSLSFPSPSPSFESMKPVKDSLNSSRKSSSSSYSSFLSEERTDEPQRVTNFPSRPQISVAPYPSERSPVIPFGVAAHIEQFERLSESSLEALKTATLERAKNRRQKEILDNLRHQVEAAKKSQASGTPVIVAAEREEVAWREQERRAKEAERRIREIARRAREEHRRTSSSSAPELNGSESDIVEELRSPTDPFLNGDINGNIKSSQDDFSNNNGNLNGSSERSHSRSQSPYLSPRLRPFRPPSKEAVIEWFKEEELPKGVGLNRRKTAIESWFHGIISRTEAERILDSADTGSFLVRVSERIWGYAVSYKAPDRFRHYLIDAIGGRYAFLGSHQNTHLSLGNLIDYHRKEFITSSGREVLDKPCGQVDTKRPDYIDLLLGTSYLNLISPKN